MLIRLLAYIALLWFIELFHYRWMLPIDGVSSAHIRASIYSDSTWIKLNVYAHMDKTHGNLLRAAQGANTHKHRKYV